MPAANSLAVGELAINVTDGKFYTKTTGGVVREVGGAVPLLYKMLQHLVQLQLMTLL